MRANSKAAVALTVRTIFRRFLLAGLAAAAVTACGGGGDSDPGTSHTGSVTFGYVSIDFPTTEAALTTESDSLRLSGASFISNTDSTCCTGSATDSGVSVTWSTSTGASGRAAQAVQYCDLFTTQLLPCNPTWSAEIPLAVGVNVITVLAADSHNDSGQDTITVTRNADVKPPTVGLTYPARGAIDVAANGEIYAKFNEAMDDASFTSTAFKLRDSSGNEVAGYVTYSYGILKFAHAGHLAAYTTYTATISTVVRDVAGNAMSAPYSWDFTIGYADMIPPSVTATSPAAGETCAAADSSVTAYFSEDLQPDFIKQDNLLVKDTSLKRIEGTVSSTGNSITFTPYAGFSNATSYTATVTTALMDLAQNHLAADYSWTFRTTSAATGTWRSTSTVGIPAQLHSEAGSVLAAVWTGTEMLIWSGGREGTPAGARYNPVTDTWTPINNTGAPAFNLPVAVWTGSEMIVWGAIDLNITTGARYNPATDSWRPLSNVGAPRSGSDVAAAVWTGNEMVVLWSGSPPSNKVGGRYNPALDSWLPISSIGAPAGGAAAVWTGERMIVWGGFVTDPQGIRSGATNSGGVYDPSTDTWESMATSGAPSPRSGHTAVWTGTEMLVWGGYTTSGPTNTGARYDPRTKTWRSVSTDCGASARRSHTAVWSGNEMIVWGGSNGASTGGRYDPSTDSWRHSSIIGAPSPRTGQVGLWTGTSMLIWGGNSYQGPTGGIYEP